MSEDKSQGQKSMAVDDMLRDWSVVEPKADFWDENAARVAERLESAQADADQHGALLSAPLPPEEGEPFGKSAAPEEPAPRSLAELARMAVEASAPAPESSEIAKESLSLAALGRASAPVIAEAHAREVAERAELERMRASAPPAVPSELAARAAPPPRRSAAGPLAMAGIGLLGLAAAAVIVVRAQRASAPEPVAAAAPTALPAAPAAATQAQKPDDVVALEDLAPGKGAGASPSPRAPTSGGEKLAAKAEAKPEEPKPGTEKPSEPSAAPPKPEEKKDEEAAKMKPAATAGDVPDKPSTGAVQAAIGSVMGSARACVAGQDEDSRATITFGSDGMVKSVAVSGKAAGTPAEACIKAALGKARVQPFARPTFSVGATIRP
ncbi:MAG: hypothetical protein U0263_12910 [Polyangiaceae bacterium]